MVEPKRPGTHVQSERFQRVIPPNDLRLHLGNFTSANFVVSAESVNSISTSNEYEYEFWHILYNAAVILDNFTFFLLSSFYF